MATKLQQKTQNPAKQMKQICSGMKEYLKSTSHPSWLFMRLFMTATFFICMHHPLWIMESVLIAVMSALKSIVSISGRYRICPFLVSG